MRISERQLRGIINEEIRNRSFLNEQTDPATAAAQAKNVTKTGNVITWSDNAWDYKADVSSGAIFAAKKGQPLKPVASGTGPYTAIKAVVAQLNAAPAAGAGAPTPAPGSPGCTLPQYRGPLTQALAGIGLAATYIAFMVDLILTGSFRGMTSAVFAAAAAKMRTAGGSDGIMGTIAAAGRTIASMSTLGTSEALTEFIANLLNATAVGTRQILAAQQKFTRTCDIRVFATDIGNAFSSYLGSFGTVTRDIIASYIQALQRTGQAIASAIGLPIEVLINLLSFIGALLAIGTRAVVAGISSALIQAGNDLTRLGNAMRESRHSSGRTMRESIEARRARNHRIMKQLALEMYQVSRANQLLSEMPEENRKLLIRSLI